MRRAEARSVGRFSRQGLLNRWGMAAALDGRLPQVRGRDRLLRIFRSAHPPRALQSDVLVRWGPGLSATINPSLDGSLRALFAAQWVRPALIPILEACLRPGDLFVDVGANVGVYTTWAARIVGAKGNVIALEPAPRTRTWLEDICVQNGLAQVNIIPSAAGDATGTALMQIQDGASGLSRLVDRSVGSIEVPLTTLDTLLASKPPALIKIDVEGHELRVLEGARQTLQHSRVPVVFEAPDFGGGSGTLRCVQLLETAGYKVLSLTPRGIRAFDPSSYSHNLLAIHRADHLTEGRLQKARFPLSQNT
jgi:FkbM family methyltransferase